MPKVLWRGTGSWHAWPGVGFGLNPDPCTNQDSTDPWLHEHAGEPLGQGGLSVRKDEPEATLTVRRV